MHFRRAKLAMAFFLAAYLNLVPMAYIASNMVKWKEIKSVHAMNRFHIFLMYFTATVVLFKDILTGVRSAMIIYALLYKFFDRPNEMADDRAAQPQSQSTWESLADEVGA